MRADRLSYLQRGTGRRQVEPHSRSPDQRRSAGCGRRIYISRPRPETVILGQLNPDLDGIYVRQFQTRWLKVKTGGNAEQINLDGEPYLSSHVRFEIIPKAIKLVLPADCPCVSTVRCEFIAVSLNRSGQVRRSG